MKKRILALALVVVLILSTTVFASPRVNSIVPLLQFNGKTANCYVEVAADKSDAQITVTARLWRGSTCLETWTETGTEYVFLSESKVVSVTGVTYKLTADVTINGEVLDQVYTTAKCPFN